MFGMLCGYGERIEQGDWWFIKIISYKSAFIGYETQTNVGMGFTYEIKQIDT